jgi:hypothetical protein
MFMRCIFVCHIVLTCTWSGHTDFHDHCLNVIMGHRASCRRMMWHCAAYWAVANFPRSLLPPYSGCKCIFFLSWGEIESTWYCSHCLAYCTSRRW